MAINAATISSLTAISPNPDVSQLLQQFVPPREFAKSSFDNYIPSPDFDSQSKAVELCRQFAKAKGSISLEKRGPKIAGIYLDGGFGVGKTHLLASIFHAFKGKKLFGSFLAYTGLIGVLGFANAVQALKSFDLICIDEFELDDPGDTMMMSRLLSELDAVGVKFATTSNTPPNALGQGRFAAADFAREINAMADRFQMVTIDGQDYRHRPVEAKATSLSETELDDWVAEQVSLKNKLAKDDFSQLLRHLATIHPSKYLNLIQEFDALAITDVTALQDQVAALRFVALVDRLYENQVAVRNTGHALTQIFSDEMIGGAYRKKYLRAVSRLGALTS